MISIKVRISNHTTIKILDNEINENEDKRKSRIYLAVKILLHDKHRFTTEKTRPVAFHCEILMKFFQSVLRFRKVSAIQIST